MRSIKPLLVTLVTLAAAGAGACEEASPEDTGWSPGNGQTAVDGTSPDTQAPPTATDASAPATQVPVSEAEGGTPSEAGTLAVGPGGMDRGSTSVPADLSDASTDASATDARSDAGAEATPDVAVGLHELFIHDACTTENPSQPDTCIHAQRVETEVTLGGDPGTVYGVRLRVRGVFEPTTIRGGESPLGEHPYFKVGGDVIAADYSQWHIAVRNPPQTYWLNHYPSTSHTIYSEDFEVTIPMAGGTLVTVGVVDGNDREINNGQEGLPDRRQLIDGVTPEVLDGQVLRLDVVSVMPE